MIIATVELESIAPYSQSKHYETPKKDKEGSADYETRTWRDRCHVDEKGFIQIPPMAFKNCIAEAAKFLSIQIQGKGKATFTKHFEAGIMVVNPIPLPIKKDEVAGEWFFVPADGKRGSGKRVKKCFPLIPKWSGKVEFFIIDQTITKDVFIHHLKEAGNLIGIGRFRPRNNGFYGRFMVNGVSWKE